VALRLCPRHALSLVFQNLVASTDPGEREYAASVDRRRTYNDAAHAFALPYCCDLVSDTMCRRGISA
jgi:hypothetical protein